MDLILKDVQNKIGEIELGDVFYYGKFDEYYIVIYNHDVESYYLKSFNGDSTFYSHSEYDSLESLRDGIVKNDDVKFVHYPAKEYHLELVKTYEIKKDGI